MTSLTTLPVSSLTLAPLSQADEIALTRMANGLEPDGLGFVLPAALAPSPERRQQLTERGRVLAGWLAPAGERAVIMEISPLLDAMASRGTSEIGLEARLRVYVADLADVPLAALRGAARAFRRGEVGYGTFAPTPGELRQEALRRCDGPRQEADRIARVLGAKVAGIAHDPEAKARNVARAAELIAELSKSRDPLYSRVTKERPHTMAEAQGWLEAEAGRERPPIQLSDRILRQFQKPAGEG